MSSIRPVTAHLFFRSEERVEAAQGIDVGYLDTLTGDA